MKVKMTAPLMGRYEFNKISFGNYCCLTEESEELYKQFFCNIKKLKPCDKNGERWRFWVSAPRGEIEDFGDYEELHDMGEDNSYEEFERSWKDWYSKEVYWYLVTLISANGYTVLFINNSAVVSTSPDYKNDWDKRDVKELLLFLIDETNKIFEMLEAGTYNDYLKKALPYEYKTGTIQRSKLWQISAKEKKGYCEDLTDNEIAKFITYCKEGEPKNRIKEMTAQKYFDACAICYAAAKFEGIENMTAKEMYIRYADNRDGGFSKLEENSSKAFEKWYRLSSQEKWKIENPSHLWEISQGGSRTRIHLFVCDDKNGYYLRLAGAEHCRAPEIVRMYNALKDKDYPVIYYNHDLVAKAIIGADEVGIIPCTDDAYSYWYGGFKKDNIISFIRLNEEHFSEKQIKTIIKNALWFDIEPLELNKEV